MTPFVIRENATSLELFDAAEKRQTAARNALALLASARDLGCPDGDLLAGALSGLELLLKDAAELYDAARHKG
ncbi:hypothetical protein NK553_05750 [Pseudomonas sp. ZM23]|uniref:DUF3077 domain-containing protein n=1 Tax=Pseudomonas triclosanedens TaxID=2961893 RepID=A0ABY6ZWH1_9PSED|nr:hypothetical protein [Pseudomonas triclosanedens]MCP8463451.1 hypothetical protein [Pseudomonas triclosanedens]MCP8469490.1 hypothetical protein [Pseudomonas triclosanedens]MCP8474252.1 hypothetical protein [Pseudomonas triclosanedens]WAI48360.1 hypothetical protein OU419_21750 [Pseudomonas triclosanedens]